MGSILKTFVRRNQKTLLFCGIVAGTLLYVAIGFWKYAHFRYNAIDLAYFSQVFWNSLHGHFFAQSIHPHPSLGDHAELAIPVLLPFYALWQDPRMLIILQAAALALCAWPLWLLAQRHLPRNLALLVPALWLASPFIGNIALFEFHILPFALLPLFLMLLEYDRRRFWPMLGYAALALIVREDVALVVVMLGVLAWLEHRSWRWRIAPTALAVVWFFAATKLIGHFSPDGSYKFLIYYRWLGNTPTEVITSALLHPIRVLSHVVTLPNVEMLLGFMMAVALLPLLAPRRLLLAALPLLQIILGAPGGGELILETHYATLFLPALFLATIEGLRLAPDLIVKMLDVARRPATQLVAALALVSVAFSMVAFGPLPGMVSALADKTIADDAVQARAALARIPNGATVAASYAFLPHLSSRERLYSLHYVFLGVTQFAETPYPLPPDISATILDADDLLTYRAQFLNTAWAAPHYDGGMDRLRPLLGTETTTADCHSRLLVRRSHGEGGSGNPDSCRYLLFSPEPGTTPSFDRFLIEHADALASDDSVIVLDGLRSVVRVPATKR